MSIFDAEELALIRISQMQRETLERWAIVCAGADQYEHAEQLAEAARAAQHKPQEIAA